MNVKRPALVLLLVVGLGPLAGCGEDGSSNATDSNAKPVSSSVTSPPVTAAQDPAFAAMDAISAFNVAADQRRGEWRRPWAREVKSNPKDFSKACIDYYMGNPDGT